MTTLGPRTTSGSGVRSASLGDVKKALKPFGSLAPRRTSSVPDRTVVTRSTKMPKPGGSVAKDYIAPLSSRERLILAEWERARVSRVTRAEIAARWGDVADKITSALVRKKLCAESAGVSSSSCRCGRRRGLRRRPQP